MIFKQMTVGLGLCGEIFSRPLDRINPIANVKAVHGPTSGSRVARGVQRGGGWRGETACKWLINKMQKNLRCL
jgi:hypothetical protein